jgi:hypothetical protein
MKIHYRESEFGFEYGSARVTRLASDEKTGAVVIRVASPKSWVDVYVTRTGKIRVFTRQGEMKE